MNTGKLIPLAEPWVLVVGGRRSGSQFLNEVDLVSLDPHNYPVPDCLKRRGAFPAAHTEAVGQSLTKGILCGS